MTARSPHISFQKNIPSGYTNKGEAMYTPSLPLAKESHLLKCNNKHGLCISKLIANQGSFKGRSSVTRMVYARISPSRSLHSIAHCVCISEMMLSEITTVRLHQSSSLKPAEAAHFYIYKKVLKTGSMPFFFFFFTKTASKTAYNTDFCIAVAYSTNVLPLLWATLVLKTLYLIIFFFLPFILGLPC